MTLEEAIEHAEKVAEENEKISLHTPVEFIPADLSIEQCQKCADDHRQLADWLRELQAWRKAYDDCVNTDYESIDDSVRRLTIIGKVVNVENVFANIRRTDGQTKSD